MIDPYRKPINLCEKEDQKETLPSGVLPPPLLRSDKEIKVSQRSPPKKDNGHAGVNSDQEKKPRKRETMTGGGG